MRISKEELRFDFRGAVFNLEQPSERKLLGWIFNQFLYGEVTGIQCGHWLYEAPHLNAASFLAKQASEELSHVRKILRILTLLGEKPGPAHWATRFLSTGMMGGSWGEHVALEMALGEGLVLGVFYAMIDTIEQPEIRKILEQATLEEERHVEFGERETIAWLAAHPESQSLFLGLAVLQLWTLRRMRGFVLKRLIGAEPAFAHHPVLSRFGEFYDHTVRFLELRVVRLGISKVPLGELSTLKKLSLIAQLPGGKLRDRLGVKLHHRRLTENYLRDPVVQNESERPTD